MDTTLADWAIPGGTVYEKHCSARTYKTLKVFATTVASADDSCIVVETGGRYSVIDGSTIDGVTSYLRDDPKNNNRYFLLVGPDDPRAQA